MVSLLAAVPFSNYMMGYNNYGYGMMGGWGVNIVCWLFGLVVFIDLVLIAIYLIQRITKK